MKKRKLIPISKSCVDITEGEVRKYATFLTADDSNVDCNMTTKPSNLCGSSTKKETFFSQLECTNSRSNIVDPCLPALSPKPESNYVQNKKRKRSKDLFSCKGEKTNEPESSYVAEYRKHELEELDKLIRFKRTPEQLKEHREALDYLCLERKRNFQHEAAEIPDETSSVIEFNSFNTNKGKTKKGKSEAPQKVNLQYASASSSEEKILFLSEEVLELRNPRSGTVINETVSSQEKLPFSSYDPRKLQCDIGAGPYTIKKVCRQNYVKVPDFTDTEYSAKVPTYDPTVHHIFRGKLFKAPCNQLLQKGTMIKILFQANRAIENEEYCSKSFRRPKSIATIYCAYVTLFTIHPKFWSVEVMDRILNEGEMHWWLSTKACYQNPNGDFDLKTYIKNLDATIRIRPVIEHQIDKPPNLLKVFTMVFQHYFSIIFVHKDLYLLITKKTENSFYIFDPNSRTSKLNRDPSHGRAKLFTVQSVEGLIDLLYNYSWKQYPDKYIGKKYRIYEIGLDIHRFQKKTPSKPLSKGKKKYCILNRFCAIITGTVGIDVPVYTTDENASILVVYIAILYACIDAPRHWSPRTVNALIHYGGQYYMTFMKLRCLEKVFINDLPPNVVLGAFSGDITLTPYFESGFLEDASSYRRSPMRKALLKYFRNNSKAILQIDNTYLGIWTDKKNFFYVFDPFARARNGLVVPPPFKGHGGVLQMHCKFDSMCRLVYMIAIKVIRRGYYYLHGYKLNAINLLTTNKNLRTSSCGSSTGTNFFEKLYIFYPNRIDLRAGIKEREKGGGSIEIAVPLECLSNLSVSPCQRASSERDFINKQKLAAHSEEYANALECSFSLKTLQDSDKVFSPDSEIVTELVLSDILDSVDHCLNTIEERLHYMGIRAKTVLLKSDIDNLDDMTEKIRIGLIKDSELEKLLSEPICRMPKSEEDENTPTNYIKMINGIDILYGKPIVQANESDEELFAMLTRGVTSAYAAIICASRYDISTWNSGTVNAILSVGEQLQLKFQDANTIQTLLNNKFPTVKIGVANFTTTTKFLGFFEAKNMYDTLKKSCNCYKKLIIIFSSFNCAFIVQRNAYYLFFGLPCDEFGFRTRYSDICDDEKTNRACVLKIYSLKAVVDRILFDRMDRLNENFILVNVVPNKKIEQLDDKDNVEIDIGDSEVNREVIMQETIRKQKIENHIECKLCEMEEVKQKERARIKWFYDLKETLQPGNTEDKTKIANLTSKSNKPSPAKIPKKHPVKEGTFKETPPLHDDNDMEDQVFGLIEDKDGSFKLQGNANLTDFYRQDFNKIKACHFASAYAILQSIILPIHKWRPSIIDKIIKKADTLYSRVHCRDIRLKRFIKNLELDQYTFDICITLAQQYNKNQTHITKTFYKILKKRKYFLMQNDQATFAIYYDKFFHLFNSYSLQSTPDGEDEAERGNKKYVKDDDDDELNGAGWIIFPNVEKLQEYLTNLSGDTCWETHYNIYFVEIMKFGENSSILKANNFMKQPFKPINMTDKEPQDRDMWCKIKGEKLSWMSPCIPIWSRKNKRLDVFKNEIGNKYKAFDIEIQDELYSLFGALHPMAATFCSTRGKQYLATHVLSCCIAHLYRVTEWNSFLLDTIVINGDRYHQESFKPIKDQNFEIAIEHLNTSYKMEDFKFGIDIRKDAYGIFFCHPNSEDFNLAKALRYFFDSNNRYGILTFEGRSITFGLANKGYFLYDCQSYGHPLFRTDEGASYCLLCNTLHRLIYCIMLAINIRKHIEFVIYSVHIRIKKTSKILKNECEQSKNDAINIKEAKQSKDEENEEKGEKGKKSKKNKQNKK